MELDLMAEWLGTPSLNSRQRRQLEERDVTREAIHRAGGLGWARISTAGRLYTTCDASDVALIQPVWYGPAPSIHQNVEQPELADLIAWRLDAPSRWYYRAGIPGAALGADNLDIAHAESWPICFALTPLGWLLGGCRGAVLLEICEGHWRAVDEAEEAKAASGWWGGAAA